MFKMYIVLPHSVMYCSRNPNMLKRDKKHIIIFKNRTFQVTWSELENSAATTAGTETGTVRLIVTVTVRVTGDVRSGSPWPPSPLSRTSPPSPSHSPPRSLRGSANFSWPGSTRRSGNGTSPRIFGAFTSGKKPTHWRYKYTCMRFLSKLL